MKTCGNYKFNYYTGRWERKLYASFAWLVWLESHANHRGGIKRKFGVHP